MDLDTGNKRPYVRRTGTRAEKQAANTRRWRKRNAAHYRQYVQQRAKLVAQVVALAKDRPCADCHCSYPSYVMDFDHVRGEKSFDIGHSSAAQGMKATLAEIAKCEVVCANCHRERTHSRQ